MSTAIRGLKDEIRDEIARLGKPTTFPDLFELAVRIDNRLLQR